MENSNPTCFVSLEIPLTVTFTVENDDDEEVFDWNGEDLGKRHLTDFEYTSILKNYSALRMKPKSFSVSDISDKIQDDIYNRNDESLEPENEVDITANKILLKCNSFKYGIDKRNNFLHFCDSSDQLQDSKEDIVDSFVPSSSNSLDDHDHFCDDHEDHIHYRSDDHFKNVDFATSCTCCADLVCNSRTVETNDEGDYRDEDLALDSKMGIPFAENCSENNGAAGEAVASAPLDGREEFDLAVSATVPDYFQPKVLGGSDRSLKPEFAFTVERVVLSSANHRHISMLSSGNNDDLKLKSEKTQMDLGYFTEEGNEGGRDEEECNESRLGTSASNRLSASAAKISPNNDCYCEEINTVRNRKNLTGRSKIGILKHSRASSSFDFSSSSASLKDNNNRTDCYHILSDSTKKSVGFYEYPILPHRWCFTIDSDSSQAMDKLRAVTKHLCLPVNHASRKDGFIENYSQPGTHQRRNLNASIKIDTWENEDSRVNPPHPTPPPAIVHDNMNEFFTRIKQELFQLRKADEKIASRLLMLYGEIKHYKYVHNCNLYREMMETAIDNEDKKDELSRHHVDAIPERLCATFKQWGLTRINLQRRRFSIF